MGPALRRGPSWARYLRFLLAFRRERGLLLVQLAPVLFAIDRVVLPEGAPAWAGGVQAGAAASLALGGLLLPYRPSMARALAAATALVGAAPVAPQVLERPELLVVGALGFWAIFHLVFSEPTLVMAASAAPPARWRTARSAALLALLVWFIEVLALTELGPIDAAVTALPLVLAGVFGVRWARAEQRGRTRILVAAALVSVAGASASVSELELALTWLLPIPLTTLVLARGEGAPLGRFVEHPARLLVVTFFGLSALGVALLALPDAASSGRSIGILDAAFTSVSAVCVTGLVVLDTPAAFSAFGEVTLLFLIQVGGLGIMAFYTVAFAALGRRLSLRHERAVAGVMNMDDQRELVGSLRRVLTLTLAAEGAGALALFAAFVARGEGAASALWRALFTAVSAFCNAGFTLQTDNLVPYQSSPLVLYTVATLIVIGSLSPAAVVAAPRWVRGQKIALRERLNLVTTAALLASGALLYGLFEWSVSLAELSPLDRVHNAVFQAVTIRTAGFNSVDLTLTRPATRTLMIVLMLIGGSPGGTAGGVKTTTVAVIVLMVGALLRGRREVVVAGRRLGTTTVFKAGAVVTAGVGTFLLALLAVQLTQPLELEVAAFEVAAALGTAGTSLGGASRVDGVGKIILMACMFAGRVGPLTLFVFLTEQQRETSERYPEQEVDVG